ncbi:MAG: aldolase catalytic domain-containing protein [Lachnospiraceae bacterium]|nr:aldolase catalytic domain-containing protein [Lachnospiraceae bacterium]
MGEIKLLDCTLRDGGYVNDWEFGHNNLVSIFERIVGAGVDIIEVGFLDDRRPFDMNRSIMPDSASVERIYGKLDRKQAMVVGMIDYGTCSIEHIQPCEESYLDGIRVIFKKHIREQAIAYCRQLKELGYKVFVQLVSITSYEDDELMDLIRLANDLEPYAVSMVDTYGLMHQENLMHYYKLLNQYLKPSIGLGYHSHNNFQMAYANCIEMLSHETERMVLVDGTIYGMGKSAGNAPIELLAMHLNDRFGTHYDISQMLEAVDANVMPIYKMTPWGYNMFFFIAASNDCHPNYVSYLMNKRTLSVKSINEILSKLEGEKQLMYDQKLIEQLYLDYQNIEVNDEKDIAELTEKFKEKNVLLLGPGLNVQKQFDRIKAYVEEKKPIVVSVNFISGELNSDYVFLSNSKRYVQLATALSQNPNLRVIATSNVTKTDGRFDYTLQYSSLLDEAADGVCMDNSFIMLLKVMKKIGVKSVALGGFDGYIGDKKQNYINAYMEYSFNKEQAEKTNQYVTDVLDDLKKDIDMNFITDSLYTKTV